MMAKKQFQIGCDKCHGDGFAIDGAGSLSIAKLCSCAEKCAVCGGVGSVFAVNEKGYNYLKPCPVCGVVRRNLKLYNLAAIPSRYSDVLQPDARFKPKNQRQEHALVYAKDFVKKYPAHRGFLLMGRAGLGKTHLAIGAISELMLKYGVRCSFKDFFYLLTELKEAYTQSSSENDVLQPLIDAEVLVIDELGKGKNSEWELNILDQLISKRYNASKTTLITTNFVSREASAKQGVEDRDILEVRVGERISSRLWEMCEFLPMEGKDHRRLSKKNL
ncbi:MAG: ATP-binding protein [Deltaproteobacteria bacterium]